MSHLSAMLAASLAVTQGDPVGTPETSHCRSVSCCSKVAQGGWCPSFPATAPMPLLPYSAPAVGCPVVGAFVCIRHGSGK